MPDDRNSRPAPCRARRRANPLAMVHAQRRVAQMWAIALERFRDYLLASSTSPVTPMEDRDASH